MRIGLIGVGVIADYHRRAILEIEGTEIAGVFDKFPEATQRFAGQHGLKAYSSIEAMIKEGGCQLVTIATPSGFHLEPTLEAARCGANILSEKPMEITTQRVNQMLQACRDAGVLLGGILQFRTYAGPRKAREVILSGQLGRILVADAYIKYYRTQEYYDSAAWRGTWALDGGGATMNQGIHWIDLIEWLVGAPLWVQAVTATMNHNIEVEDVAHAIVKWKCGAQGIIEATTCAKPGIDTRIEIHGEKGTIQMDGTRIRRMVIDGEEDYIDPEMSAAGGFDKPTSITTDGHRFHIQDMIQAIQTGRQPIIPPEEAIKSVRLISSIYRSSYEDRRVEVDSDF